MVRGERPIKLGIAGSPRKIFRYRLGEPVPWGKGEKHPDEGSEIDLKPDTYKQMEPKIRSG